MSDNGPSFMELVVDGRRLPTEIDDFVNAWHHGGDSRQLHEFLGMTPEEYDLWVRSADFLDLIIAARHTSIPLRDVANDNLRNERRIAARSDRAWKIALLQKWIDQQIDRSRY
jgi:hypothetical protein